MVTELQAEEAVATPVVFVLVLVAGHSRTTLGGRVSVGAVVSCTVMVWMPLVVLPQASVAVQVRRTTLVPPQWLLTTSLYAMVTELQAEEAVATPV